MYRNDVPIIGYHNTHGQHSHTYALKKGRYIRRNTPECPRTDWRAGLPLRQGDSVQQQMLTAALPCFDAEYCRTSASRVSSASHYKEEHHESYLYNFPDRHVAIQYQRHPSGPGQVPEPMRIRWMKKVYVDAA